MKAYLLVVPMIKVYLIWQTKSIKDYKRKLVYYQIFPFAGVLLNGDMVTWCNLMSLLSNFNQSFAKISLLCLSPDVAYSSVNKHKAIVFLFYRFFSQQVSFRGWNKNRNKIHSDHFPIELKSKELWFLRFKLIGKWSEWILFYQLKWQYLTRCCHWG